MLVDPSGLNPGAGCIAGSWAGPAGCGAGALIGTIGLGLIMAMEFGGDSANVGGSCPPPDDKDPCKGLRNQLRDHQNKLDQYLRDPLSMDNKGFLQKTIDEENWARFWAIRASRIKSLKHQISNFKKQLRACERMYGK